MRRFLKPPDKSGNYRKRKGIINHSYPLLEKEGDRFVILNEVKNLCFRK